MLLLSLALLAGACGNNDGGTAELPATAESTFQATPTATATPTREDTPTAASPFEATPTATATPTPVATPDPPPAAEPPPEVTPTPESGPHPSGLDMAAIRSEVAEWMDQTRVPGLLLAVARGDDEPWTFGWGQRDLATGEPMTPDDYVRIGSISKTVTTAAVLSLVDEGILDLDTPITAYLGDDWYGDYEYGPDITLRHLMGHTAGFVEYAFDPAFFVLGAARLNIPIAPEEIVRFSTTYGPVADFGTEYHYSTAGHVVAGLVIEAVTGNPAHAEIRSRIFEPLGVENTYLTPSEFPPEPVTEGYNSGFLVSAFESLTTVPDEARVTFKGRDYITTMSYPQEFLQSAGWTGGGLEALIGDVPRIFRGLFARGIVSDASLAEMARPSVNPDYGLGLGLGEIGGQRSLSHGGGVPGFRSAVYYLPELDLTIAGATNLLNPEPDIGHLLRALFPIVMESWGLPS